MVSLCLEISLIICPEIFGQGEFIPDIDQPRIEIGVSSEVRRYTAMVPVDMVP